MATNVKRQHALRATLVQKEDLTGQSILDQIFIFFHDGMCNQPNYTWTMEKLKDAIHSSDMIFKPQASCGLHRMELVAGITILQTGPCIDHARLPKEVIEFCPNFKPYETYFVPPRENFNTFSLKRYFFYPMCPACQEIGILLLQKLT